MAQTKRKRRRKHRGTQGGSVDRRRRRRPRSREEARAQARRQAEERRMRAPTWRSAFYRALIGGVIFFAMMAFLFGRSASEALGLAAVMVAIYVPLGYYLDRFIYSRRRRAAALRQGRRPG